MKKRMALVLLFVWLLALAGCAGADGGNVPAATDNAAVIAQTETEPQNEVLQFLDDRYGRMFKLWGPEGTDLYAFYIYPEHAQRECRILMPANTDDVSEFHENLSWEVVGDELRITGEWEEAFRIDISGETATSTATGKVYQIYKMDPETE